MTISTIFIVRHALRLDSIDKTWTQTSPTPYDTPLASPQGFDQARKTGDAIAALVLGSHAQGKALGSVAIHSSPFLRCAQTANCIASSLAKATAATSLSTQQPSQCILRLDAFLGEWQTPDYYSDMISPPSDGHAELQATSLSWLAQHVETCSSPSTTIDYTWPLSRCGRAGEYGETWAAMHARVTSGLEQLLAQYSTDPSLQQIDTLVLVSHGAACNPLIGDLLRAPILSVIGVASYCGLSTWSPRRLRAAGASRWTVVSSDGDTETESESSSLDESEDDDDEEEETDGKDKLKECQEDDIYDEDSYIRHRQAQIRAKNMGGASGDSKQWRVVATSPDLAELFVSWGPGAPLLRGVGGTSATSRMPLSSTTATSAISSPHGFQSGQRGSMITIGGTCLNNNVTATTPTTTTIKVPVVTEKNSIADTTALHNNRAGSGEAFIPQHEELLHPRGGEALLERPPGLSTSNSTSCSSFDVFGDQGEYQNEEQDSEDDNINNNNVPHATTIQNLKAESVTCEGHGLISNNSNYYSEDNNSKDTLKTGAGYSFNSYRSSMDSDRTTDARMAGNDDDEGANDYYYYYADTALSHPHHDQPQDHLNEYDAPFFYRRGTMTDGDSTPVAGSLSRSSSRSSRYKALAGVFGSRRRQSSSCSTGNVTPTVSSARSSFETGKSGVSPEEVQNGLTTSTFMSKKKKKKPPGSNGKCERGVSGSSSSPLTLSFGKMALEKEEIGGTKEEQTVERPDVAGTKNRGSSKSRGIMFRPTFPALLKKRKPVAVGVSVEEEDETKGASMPFRVQGSLDSSASSSCDGDEEENGGRGFGLYKFGSNQRLASY